MPAHVVIVGAGFAGLNAAKGLAHLPVDVTVVDRRNHYTFQPLLYQVALAVLSPADIAQPIRSILRHQRNTQVLMDEVVGIDVYARSAHRHGQRCAASTTTTSCWPPAPRTPTSATTNGSPLAPGLKTIEDATEIRRRVLLAFELAERQMVEQGWHPPLNFVVIGGGPTGVELAGAISDIAQLYMRHDFRHIDPTKSRVLLLDSGPRVLAAYPADLSAKAEATLKRLGVEVTPERRSPVSAPAGLKPTACVPRSRGHSVGRRRAGLAAGQAAGRAAQRQPRSQIRLRASCRRPAQPARPAEVFVLGDLAHFEQDGHQIPGVAQPAIQMGDHVAKMIAADLAGKPRPAFRYFDKGDMATIGRMDAVAKVEWPFKAHMSGFPAWFTWVTVHIFFLIGFRNRISVMAEWAWTYFTFTRGARLITGDQTLPGWTEQTEAGPAEPDAQIAATKAPE
jgi:NADH:ubiquinone reductase (H+-translocating)